MDVVGKLRDAGRSAARIGKLSARRPPGLYVARQDVDQSGAGCLATEIRLDQSRRFVCPGGLDGSAVDEDGGRSGIGANHFAHKCVEARRHPQVVTVDAFSLRARRHGEDQHDGVRVRGSRARLHQI